MDSSDFLSRLKHVKKVGGSQWCADCPSCGDKKQHLYISFAPNGKILLDCKKGCSFADIAAALDIRQNDFFPPSERTKKEPWELMREHIYTDISGGVLAKKQIFRKPDGSKTAVWYRLEKGAYIKGLNGMKLPLYHLHKFTKMTGTLVVVEGEKDVETVEQMEIAATTSPNGAGAKFRKDLIPYFKGRNVVIITDNDDAGKKYGLDIAEKIVKTASGVKLIGAAEIYPQVSHKGDISDIAAEVGIQKAKELLTQAVAAAVPFALSPPAADTPVQSLPDETVAADNPITLKFAENPPESFPFNDKGNSALFGCVFGDVCRFNVTANEWYVYECGYWQADTGGMLTSRFAKQLHSELIRHSIKISDESRQKSFLDNVNRMSRLNVREIMIKDSKEMNFIKSEILDSDPWLFNCKNGVYDLRNGYFRQHRPDDLMSRMSNVVFDENADCPVFKKFFREITSEDTEKARFLQTVFGYCLTGDTSQECFFILYGSTTRNGKGTLMETFCHMLGNDKGYAAAANPESFAVHRNRDSRQASGDIARLNGARCCNVSEPPKGMQLDAALMKTLTGRDTITARHLREREFQFRPQFKIIFNTNYLPYVNDESLFNSDRVRIITFDRHFGENERDLTLKDRLITQNEISGLFNWCLEGLKRYRSEGLIIPQCVKAATGNYRSDCDRQLIFFNECMTETPGRNCKAKDAFEVYRSWCKANGFQPENKTNFIAGLRRRNVLSEHGTVDGVTAFNVICDYSISPEYIPGSSEEYEQMPPF